jgi:hypothetical protein
MIKTPDEYPSQLAKYLSDIASKGLVPGKLHVSAQEISNELHEIISLSNVNDRVLICGGYELGLSSHLSHALVLENKHAELSAKMNLNIDDYSKIIVFSDWISRSVDLSSNFSFLGNSIVTSQEFYVVELAHFKHEKAIEIACDSTLFKWFQYKKWFKINSSHMHLGYKTYRSANLSIMDLTPAY